MPLLSKKRASIPKSNLIDFFKFKEMPTPIFSVSGGGF
jgi:hypothetical protein